MTTEFNYVVNVDTTRVMGAMSEVNQQMGMAMQPGGGGFGQVVGGAASGIGAMTSAMVRFPVGGQMGYGSTFTNPAMAFAPHYGAVSAMTTPGMERLIDRGGLEAAARLRPPGVSAGDFFMEVSANRIEREAEARRQGFAAARTTMMSGGGGMIAGSIASALGTRVGGAIGGRLGGSFAAGAGRLLGGLGAFMVASDVVGGAIQEHYADVERIGGVTRELGEIVGAGRGMNRAQRYGMGRAVRQAAGDLNMDVQAMGDIMSGARQMGMLPNATDPGKLREQAKNLARTIDESAQMLGTSMGNAMSVIKGMSGLGFGGREGVERLIGMAGAAGVSPMAMYGAGMQGAGIAKRVQMGGRAGFDLFTQGVMSAAGAGLSRQELGYVGGVTGLGQQIAMTQMGHAVSPLGDMQLMGMAGGGGVQADLFGTATQAMAALGKGGDPIGNMIQFEVSKRELREGLGAKGMQAMTRQAVMGYANVYQQLSPNVSEEEAFRFAAMNQFGMSSTAAQGMYAGTMGGGRGGGGGGGGTSVAEAQYNAMVGQTIGLYTNRFESLGLQSVGGRIMEKAGDIASDSRTIGGGIGAVGGYAFGGPIGGFVGGLAGAAAGEAYDFISGGGLNLNMNAADQADREFLRSAQTVDRMEEKIRQRHGLLPFQGAAYSRLVRGKMDIESLQFDTSMVDPYGVAGAQVAAQLALAGVTPVGGGPGTTKIGGQHYRTSDVAGGGNLQQIMSEKNVDRRALGGSLEWRKQMLNEKGSQIRSLRSQWDAIQGKKDDRARARAVAGFVGEARELILGGDETPEGFVDDGRMTATGRAALERVLFGETGVFAEATRGLPADVRGRVLLSAEAQRRSSEARGILKESFQAAQGLGTTMTSEATTRLLKSREMRKAVIGGARAASRGEDLGKYEAQISSAAADVGITDPDLFAKRIVLSGTLGDIGEKLPEGNELGLEADQLLGGATRRRGRGRKARESTRGEGQFQGAFNPIGFGQQESALSMINQSLQKTAGMIDKLDRRINRKPKPQ